jgi:hypothetical protein
VQQVAAAATEITAPAELVEAALEDLMVAEAVVVLAHIPQELAPAVQ